MEKKKKPDKLKPLKNEIPSLSNTLAFESKIVCFGKSPEMPKIVAEITHSSWQKFLV